MIGSIIHDEINLIKPGKNYGCPLSFKGIKKKGLEAHGSPKWHDFGGLCGKSLYEFNLKIKKLSHYFLDQFGWLRAGGTRPYIIYYISQQEIQAIGGIAEVSLMREMIRFSPLSPKC